MDKYRGTYLFQLPGDVIRELDKIQDYLDKNEKLIKAGKKLAIEITHYGGENKNVRYWNKIFKAYNIKSELKVLKKTKSNPRRVEFIHVWQENIPEELISRIYKALVSP